MKTCLHLYTPTSKDSVFYHILKYNVGLVEGDEINYHEQFLNYLSEKELKEFNQAGFGNTNFKVISTEVILTVGENMKYIFMRQIN